MQVFDLQNSPHKINLINFNIKPHGGGLYKLLYLVAIKKLNANCKLLIN